LKTDGAPGPAFIKEHLSFQQNDPTQQFLLHSEEKMDNIEYGPVWIG